MGKVRFGAAAGLLLVALVLTSCGGGDDATSSTLTKAEFISQGDKICKAATQKRIEVLQDEVVSREANGEGGFTNAEKEELLIDVILPIIDDMHRELAALEAPDEAKADQVVQEFKRTSAALKANPKDAFELNPFFEADKRAEAYGFRDCSRI